MLSGSKDKIGPEASLAQEDAREKTLIIGAGEIGRSLAEVLGARYRVVVKDINAKENPNKESYRVIHICYPYSDGFVEITKAYIESYSPEVVIIHSTVKPGTTRACGRVCVHSPVNGKHPNLANSIKTFVKFVGGTDIFTVFSAVSFLKEAGVETFVFSSPETTEVAKILCTTYYGWNIVFMKEVARICNEMGLPFQEVYTEWNNVYNMGYKDMGMPQFLRPNLQPMSGQIGGHCVIPNCELLDDFLTQTVKGRNKLYKEVSDDRKERQDGRRNGRARPIPHDNLR